MAHWIILLYATIASGCVLFASSVGITGALLNSRPILTFYNLLLWPSLLSTAIVGYSSYKSRAFNLSGKINQMWTQSWTDQDKTLIQEVVRDILFLSSGKDHSTRHQTATFLVLTLVSFVDLFIS